MVTQGIKPGDLVKCDVRGQVFYAEVTGKGEGVEIMPVVRHITYRTVKPRQIIGHYRRAKGSQ